MIGENEMTKKMVKIARELKQLTGRYIQQYEKDMNELLYGVVWITYESGEIFVFAESKEKFIEYSRSKCHERS